MILKMIYHEDSGQATIASKIRQEFRAWAHERQKLCQSDGTKKCTALPVSEMSNPA